MKTTYQDTVQGTTQTTTTTQGEEKETSVIKTGYCMNLSSLRPYEVTDFGETTIHGDDQAKNEVCYTSGMYLILHGKIIV